MILSQALIQTLAKSGSKIAFRFLKHEVKASDFLATCARLSYLFQKEIGTQKKVAFIGSNSPALAAAFVALSNNRCITIPMDPNLSDDDICEWIYEVQPSHAMVTSDLLTRIRDLFRRRGISVQVVDIEKKRGGEYNASYVPPPDQVPKDTDPILMLRTSGTAGAYKICLFNHVQVQAAAHALKRTYKAGSAEVFFTTLNWSHPFAFTHGLLFPLFSGSTCLVEHGLEGTDLLKWLVESKPTRLIGTPDFFQKLLISCKALQRTLGGVKSITVSLGSLSPALCKIFGMMNVRVAHCYGQTESLWSITMTDTTNTDAANSAAPTGLGAFDYKVVDKHGEVIEGPDVREGQLCVTGPAITMKYFAKKEEQTKEWTRAALRGTWLYTGDVFKMEGEGSEARMTFVRRLDGLNPTPKVEDTFNPVTVEKTFKKIEGVLETVAFRENQTDRGPIFVALILAEGVDLTGYQLLDQAKSGLTPKNLPKLAGVVKEIPKDAEGKTDFKALQEAVVAASKAPPKAPEATAPTAGASSGTPGAAPSDGTPPTGAAA